MRAQALLLAQAMLLALPVSDLWPMDLVAAPFLTMVSAAAALGVAVPALHVRVLSLSGSVQPWVLRVMTQRACDTGRHTRHAPRARAGARCG
jgi:hypothetical protein